MEQQRESDTPLGLELVQDHPTRPVLIAETIEDRAALVAAQCIATYAADWHDNVAFLLGRDVVLLPRTEAWADRVWWQIAGSTKRQRIVRLPQPVAAFVADGKGPLGALVRDAWEREADDPLHRPQAPARRAPAPVPAEPEPPRNVVDMQGKPVDPPRDERPAWVRQLILGQGSKPKPLLANALMVLRHAEEWRGVLAYDEFASRIAVRKDAPSGTPAGAEWSDNDDLGVTEALQLFGIHCQPRTAAEAVMRVAREHRFHPLRDYLDGLEWDRQHRLDDWLIECCGADPTPIVRAWSSRWMMGAVERAYRPGCMNRAVLVLEGPQDIGKSAVFRAIGEPWYSDDMPQLHGQESAILTRGMWLIELPELSVFARSEINAMKAFISRREDRFREVYMRHPTKSPRQAVFGGTVNPGGSGYLKDETGNTRFWPVTVVRVELERIQAMRDQLWAEAKHRWLAGESTYIDTPHLRAAAAEETDARRDADAWEDVITRYLHEKPSRSRDGTWWEPRLESLSDVSIPELLQDALGIDPGKWTDSDQKRVGRCLRALGFERYQKRLGKVHGQAKERRFRLPSHAANCTMTDPSEDTWEPDSVDDSHLSHMSHIGDIT